MSKKSMAGDALHQFNENYGEPDKMVVDGSQEQNQKGTQVIKECCKHGIQLRRTEPYHHNQSKVEGIIREAQKRWFRIMSHKNVPKRLWDYGFTWVYETMQLTATDADSMHGRTAFEAITGETPDISEYLDFSFYDLVWFLDNAGLGERHLGRWLGVSHRVRGLMSFWVLTDKGTVLSRMSVGRMTRLELQLDETKKSVMSTMPRKSLTA